MDNVEVEVVGAPTRELLLQTGLDLLGLVEGYAGIHVIVAMHVKHKHMAVRSGSMYQSLVLCVTLWCKTCAVEYISASQLPGGIVSVAAPCPSSSPRYRSKSGT